MVFGFISGIGPMELAIILLLVLILFGAGKLPQVFESFGSAVKKFREASREDAIDVSPRELRDDRDLAGDKAKTAEKQHTA